MNPFRFRQWMNKFQYIPWESINFSLFLDMICHGQSTVLLTKITRQHSYEDDVYFPVINLSNFCLGKSNKYIYHCNLTGISIIYEDHQLQPL